MNDVLTVKEAAVKLNVKPVTVRLWLRKGILTALRGPEGTSVVRLSAQEVENFLSSRGGRE